LLDRLKGRTVAVLGFGNQGEAHALNLRDQGVTVIAGARDGGGAHARALAQGFPVFSLAEAAKRCDLAAMLLPDEVLPALWPELRTSLPARAALVFAHGYNLLYSALEFDERDVVLVSPTGPGRALREVFVRGEGLPAYLAVHRDASGDGWEIALAYAEAIGSERARLWRTTVREETEVDLFGEQAVLCGGMNALVIAAFETLVARGYSPEIAYLECVHQLKYLADLLHDRGIAGLRRGISGTALFGDVTRGPRVIGPASRAELERMLEEVRNGTFAKEWAAEVAAGRPRIAAALGGDHPIEAARRSALGQPAERGGAEGESRNALSKS